MMSSFKVSPSVPPAELEQTRLGNSRMVILPSLERSVVRESSACVSIEASNVIPAEQCATYLPSAS